MIALRHAEKNLSARAQPLTPGQNLPVFTQAVDTIGFQRAAYLTGYLLGIPANNLTNPPIPAVSPLFADLITGASTHHPITLVASLNTNINPGDNAGTWRPMMTVTPIAGVYKPADALTDPNNYQASNDLITQIAAEAYPDLSVAIQQPANHDKTVVICWESKALPFMLAEVDFDITGYDQNNPDALVNNQVFISTFGTYPNLVFPGNTLDNQVGSIIFDLVFVVTYRVDSSVLKSDFAVLMQRGTDGFNNM